MPTTRLRRGDRHSRSIIPTGWGRHANRSVSRRPASFVLAGRQSVPIPIRRIAARQARAIGADLHCSAVISAISATSCSGPSGAAAVCGAVAWRIRPCGRGPVAQCLGRARRRRVAQGAAAGFDAGDAARADRTGFAGALSGPAGAAGNRPRCGAQSTGGRPWSRRQARRHAFLARGRSPSSACSPTRTSPARWRHWRARLTCGCWPDLDVPRARRRKSWRGGGDGAGLGGSVECLLRQTQAFARSAELAGENDRIVVFGSFYTVAAVMRSMQNGR
jgi:hypothetical protein